MKLGAQLYSLRTFTQNAEDLRTAILKCKAMGYQNVQFSGVANMGADVWAQISRETEMEIVCTHSAFDRIVRDTDALIAEHKVFGCSVIGIGSMPGEFRGTREALDRFFAVMEEPVKRSRQRECDSHITITILNSRLFPMQRDAQWMS